MPPETDVTLTQRSSSAINSKNVPVSRLTTTRCKHKLNRKQSLRRFSNPAYSDLSLSSLGCNKREENLVRIKAATYQRSAQEELFNIQAGKIAHTILPSPTQHPYQTSQPNSDSFPSFANSDDVQNRNRVLLLEKAAAKDRYSTKAALVNQDTYQNISVD